MRYLSVSFISDGSNLCSPSFFLSLARGLLVLSVLPKNQLLVYLIFLLISYLISLISALIFIISFLLLTLDLNCSFSSFLVFHLSSPSRLTY